MRILLIRHGDPDYVNDTLTEKGRREAALLAKRAVSMNMGECYKSPLGRAKDTAAPCLEVTGKTAEILDWLQEFPAKVDLNKNPELEKAYPDVKKEGGYFLPRIAWDMVPGYWTESDETVTFFCHVGISCVLLSHLWNVSPFVLWHCLALAPTSVTEVVTEEREQGTAYFRGLKVGDISHLYAGGEEPSFAARFCETYSNKEQRH